MNKHLQKFANQESQHQEDENINRRTISALIDSSNAWRENQKLKEQHEKKMARRRELESLVSKRDIFWNKIDNLIQEKNATAYKKVIDHLKDLRDLAEYQGKLKEFTERITDIKNSYSNCPALIRRMREGKFIS